MIEYEMPNPEIEGWMTIWELKWLYNTAKNCNSVLEIGSWQGRSTHALLSGCKGLVTCVDTWLGSPENLKDVMPAHLFKDDAIFHKFRENTQEFSNLRIVRGKSSVVIEQLKHEKFDMVFIDGGHTYDVVMDDIKNYYPLAVKVFSGHDYKFEEVQRALKDSGFNWNNLEIGPESIWSHIKI